MKTILLVEGDVIARRAIAKIIREKTDYTLIVNGDVTTTIDSVSAIKPDLLLLGIKPEKAQEIALLSTVRLRFPELPVIILNERTEAGAAVSIAGLRMGAVDFITKPEDSNSMLFADRHLSKRLLPVIKSLFQAKQVRNTDFKRSFAEGKVETLKTYWPLNLIVIGGCTGAPVALFELIESLPENFDIPIAIIQHMPKFYTNVLAARLNQVTKLTVKEASDEAVLKPGVIWIAPGGSHTEVFRAGNETLLKVHCGPRENGVRPSIDKLFRSAGLLYGPGVMGVILSGCGQDGIAGAEAIKQAGGHMIVQDYRTATIPNLPLSVIKTGQYDLMCTTDYMAELFFKRAMGTKQTIAGSEMDKDFPNKEVIPQKYKYFQNKERHLFSTLN